MSKDSHMWRLAGVEAGTSDACKKSLLSVIETQILPQLVRAHADQLSSGPAHATRHLMPSASMVAEFAQLCHQEDAQACWDMVDQLVQQRYSVPEILLNLLTPAARYLGDMWDQDRLDFSQVTTGLLRMQNMTHHYGFLNRRPFHQAGPKLRAMVASAPGSQHLLGLAMVSEFFVNDGWDVYVEVATTQDILLNAVHADWFDILGLSVGLIEQLETLPALVTALRAHSLNPHMGILLGGVALTHFGAAHPSYGADAVCLDPLEAMGIARKLATNSPASLTSPTSPKSPG